MGIGIRFIEGLVPPDLRSREGGVGDLDVELLYIVHGFPYKQYLPVPTDIYVTII